MLRRKFLRLLGMGSAAIAVGSQLPVETMAEPVTPSPLNTVAELGEMLSNDVQGMISPPLQQIVDAIREQSYQILMDSNYSQAVAASNAPRFLMGSRT